ncbi:MAG: ATP-binding cassette domain-containing protein [Acidaminococcaceae bacterium]|nr:ATP-binding cassette domain-containing protein [Acidaminococcaceae bacterium]
MALLQITSLTKIFPLENGAHTVLEDLSLTADCSGATVILGRSGCGKTTLLRLICGLETPDSGSIFLPERLRLGMVFQEARLMPWLTCRENILLGATAEVPYVDDLLEITGLTKFAAAYPHQLSGGMQQRAALARTLACKSDLILMDEPFAALDYFTRLQLQQELLKIRKLTGTGFILVTHNLDEALTLAERILILNNGRIEKSFDLPPLAGRDILDKPYAALKKVILQALLEK